MKEVPRNALWTADAQFGAIAAALVKQYPNTNTNVAAVYLEPELVSKYCLCSLLNIYLWTLCD